MPVSDTKFPTLNIITTGVGVWHTRAADPTSHIHRYNAKQ